MNVRETFQKEILEEVKSIAKELSNVQNFSGLLAHQQKIQNLYEKFIFLKQLNISKYQQILENRENTSLEEKGQAEDIRDFSPNHKEEVPPIIEKVLPQQKEALKPQGLKPLDIEIADIELPKNKEEITVSTTSKSPLELKPIKPDFSDSISFISQLFNGSKVAMDSEFAILNQTKSLEESKKWIEEMFTKYDWRDKGPQVERLSKLIIERFEP